MSQLSVGAGVVAGTPDTAGTDLAARPAGKARKTFERWIARIDAQRRQLAEWRAFAETFRTRVAKDYEPLLRRSREHRLSLLRRYDQAHDSDALSRREQTRLAQVIVDEVSVMLAHDDDPVWVALHDKYSDVRYDELRHTRTNAIGETLEERRDATPEWATNSPDDPVSDDATAAAPDNPRHARAQARIAREQALAAGATRSVRDIYRRLASAVHPDREPDPAERERKTALMQRVNRAYDSRDLLQLLTLQIEAAKTDPTRLADTSDTELDHYNRVLKEQSDRLAAEITAIVTEHTSQLPAHPRRSPTPTSLLEELNQDIALLRRECRSLAHDLELFKDVRVLKGWLKSMRVSRGPSEWAD